LCEKSYNASIPGILVIHYQGDVEIKSERNEVNRMSTNIKTETVSGNMPEKKFSTGALTATVWENQGKNKEGLDVSFRTVSFQRRYMDKNGEWQTSSSLRINDLPKASLVLQKAYEYIVMKELNVA
jgi:hypothetical protein